MQAFEIILSLTKIKALIKVFSKLPALALTEVIVQRMQLAIKMKVHSRLDPQISYE